MLPAASSLTTNALPRDPLGVERNGRTRGKSSAVVQPVTYAAPARSAAIAVTSSAQSLNSPPNRLPWRILV